MWDFSVSIPLLRPTYQTITSKSSCYIEKEPNLLDADNVKISKVKHY